MCRANRIFLSTNMKLIILISMMVPISATTSHEKVDEATVQTSIKCGECPCVNPCSQQQVPPPPPPPPPTPAFTQYCPPQTPPPPRFYYFSGPPELSQSTPPPPRFTYVIGEPKKHMYPVDPFNLEIYNRATCDCNVLLGLLLPIIYGLLQILAF